MLDNELRLTELLVNCLEKYDAIIIGEDKNVYIHGVVDVVQQVNERYLLPVYIAKTTTQLGNLKAKFDHCGLKPFYILDNKYTIEENEPKGQELIRKWGIEHDCVLITSSYLEIMSKNPPYPVFDKMMPKFDLF